MCAVGSVVERGRAVGRARRVCRRQDVSYPRHQDGAALARDGVRRDRPSHAPHAEGLRRDSAHPCHICTGTGLSLATSLPHPQRDWAPFATSTLGLGPLCHIPAKVCTGSVWARTAGGARPVLAQEPQAAVAAEARKYRRQLRTLERSLACQCRRSLSLYLASNFATSGRYSALPNAQHASCVLSVPLSTNSAESWIGASTGLGIPHVSTPPPSMCGGRAQGPLAAAWNPRERRNLGAWAPGTSPGEAADPGQSLGSYPSKSKNARPLSF